MSAVGVGTGRKTGMKEVILLVGAVTLDAAILAILYGGKIIAAGVVDLLCKGKGIFQSAVSLSPSLSLFSSVFACACMCVYVCVRHTVTW